jgi:SAM-dependent methyltransferase
VIFPSRGHEEADTTSSGDTGGGDREGVAELYKRDFWIKENKKHTQVHYRLEKSARIINAMIGREKCELLDVGCGPATLRNLLRPNIHYHGIDIAIHDPAPNLIEADILEAPIGFAEKHFDVVTALGLFEYVGACQAQKLGEIAGILGDHGKLVLTYTNFGHRDARIMEAFSNVRPFDDFRHSLAREFTIDRYFPTSYNWYGGQPARALVRAVNMHVNVNVPLLAPRLAVEYFLICSRRLQSLNVQGPASAGLAAGGIKPEIPDLTRNQPHPCRHDREGFVPGEDLSPVRSDNLS